MGVPMTRGQAGRSMFPKGYIGYHGWRSPSEREMIDSPMTEEEYAVFLNGVNANKARALRTSGDIAAAEERQRFLSSVNPAELASIHRAPTNDREAMLQEILNEDYMARERGADLSMKGMRRNEEIEMRMLPLRLQAARLNQTQNNSLFNQSLSAARLQDARRNEQAKRERFNRQFDALEEYRDENLTMREEDQAHRFQNQDRNFETRQQQLDRTNRRADANQTRNAFLDAINAMRNGASAAEMDQAFASMWPNLTPAQQSMAMAFMGQRAQENSVADTMATRYNQLLRQAPQMVASGAGSDIRSAMDSVITQAGRDPQARRFIIFDQNTRSFVPNPRYGRVQSQLGRGAGVDLGATAGGMVPEEPSYEDYGDGMIDDNGDFMMSPPSRPQPQPQRTQARAGLRDGLYQGPDGFVYRVVNGVPQRTNFRRRAS